MKNITSLEHMEDVVKNNKNLSWDGWTVVHSQPSERGSSSVNGLFKNNKWYITNRFEPSQNGWSIPDKFVR